jgi:hypothetical protein
MSSDSDTSVIYNEDYDSDNSVSTFINSYVSAYIKVGSYNSSCCPINNSFHSQYTNSFDSNYNGKSYLDDLYKNKYISRNSSNSSTRNSSNNNSRNSSNNNSYDDKKYIENVYSNRSSKINNLKKKITKLKYKFVLKELEYNQNINNIDIISKNNEKKYLKIIYNNVMKELKNLYYQKALYKNIYKGVISEINKRDIYLKGIYYKKFLSNF